MLPYWLRAFIFALLLFLVVNLFTNFPKMEPVEDKNLKLVLLEPEKTYKCVAERVKNCLVECFLISTATKVYLKPQHCQQSEGVKKGKEITFKVLSEPYHLDGSVPVKILKKEENWTF